MSTFKVNRGNEGRIFFLIYELLKFITERAASFFIAKGFLMWVYCCLFIIIYSLFRGAVYLLPYIYYYYFYLLIIYSLFRSAVYLLLFIYYYYFYVLFNYSLPIQRRCIFIAVYLLFLFIIHLFPI